MIQMRETQARRGEGKMLRLGSEFVGKGKRVGQGVESSQEGEAEDVGDAAAPPAVA